MMYFLEVNSNEKNRNVHNLFCFASYRNHDDSAVFRDGEFGVDERFGGISIPAEILPEGTAMGKFSRSAYDAAVW